MKSKRVVKSELAKLRRIVESKSRSVAEMRVAYSLEHAIRWATENTRGWTTPSTEVSEIVKLLKEGL